MEARNPRRTLRLQRDFANAVLYVLSLSSCDVHVSDSYDTTRQHNDGEAGPPPPPVEEAPAFICGDLSDSDSDSEFEFDFDDPEVRQEIRQGKRRA